MYILAMNQLIVEPFWFRLYKCNISTAKLISVVKNSVNEDSYSPNWNDTPLVYIHNIPRILKITYIRIGQQSILFIRIK